MKVRISHIDIIKGIAILSVLAGHYINNYLLGTLIWSFHMPLFIIISGYFYRERSLKETIIKSLKKIYAAIFDYDGMYIIM